MKLKTLVATATVVLVAVTAAPASAGNPCAAHLDTVFGGICIPTP